LVYLCVAVQKPVTVGRVKGSAIMMVEVVNDSIPIECSDTLDVNVTNPSLDVDITSMP